MDKKPIVVIDSDKAVDLNELLYRKPGTCGALPAYGQGQAVAEVIAKCGNPVTLVVECEGCELEPRSVPPGIMVLAFDSWDSGEQRGKVAAVIAEAEVLVAHMWVSDAFLDSVIGMAKRGGTGVFLWFSPCRRTRVRFSPHTLIAEAEPPSGNIRITKEVDYLFTDRDGAGMLLGKNDVVSVGDALAALQSLAAQGEYSAIVLTMGNNGVATYEAGERSSVGRKFPASMCVVQAPSTLRHHRNYSGETCENDKALAAKYAGKLAVGFCNGKVDTDVIATLTRSKPLDNL